MMKELTHALASLHKEAREKQGSEGLEQQEAEAPTTEALLSRGKQVRGQEGTAFATIASVEPRSPAANAVSACIVCVCLCVCVCVCLSVCLSVCLCL